jgi:integrase
MIGAGVDSRTAAGRLGHRSPAVTTGIYAHVLLERNRQAAELLGKTLELPVAGR